jgi:hypothetical protein
MSRKTYSEGIMKELKEMTLCVTPFIVSAALVYPFMAIVGANFDPFMWQRDDRMFYAISTGLFGCALFMRISLVTKEEK